MFCGGAGARSCLATRRDDISANSDEQARRQEHEHRLRRLETRRKAIAAQVAALRADAEAQAAEAELIISQETFRKDALQRDSNSLARKRGRPEEFPIPDRTKK